MHATQEELFTHIITAALGLTEDEETAIFIIPSVHATREMLCTHIITAALGLTEDEDAAAIHLLAKQPDELRILFLVRDELRATHKRNEG